MFNKCLPNKAKKFNSLWTLLRGVVMWAIWRKRNDPVFNKWHEAKLWKVMWERLVDYFHLSSAIQTFTIESIKP